MSLTSTNSNRINFDEIFKKTRINMFGNLILWPILLIGISGWTLVSGKASNLGMTVAAWIALGAGSLSFLIYIYTQSTLPDKQGYNVPPGNVIFRFIIRMIEVISVSYIGVPALCKLLENLFGFTITLPSPYNWLGLVLLAPGLGFGIWTMYTYASRGKGTTVPYEPTQQLITEGPYRYLRNPMVLATHFIMAGLVVILSSYILLFIVLSAIKESHKYIVRVEENEMEIRFGQAYLDYKTRVPRWIPWKR
ncbi:MAG: isoprenylcysteine carboxylmethyltransferase family protein [Candidatus Aminicenantes bacterium]|nr:MAG: isoprenylcysteine carboxylmethyltransferase family protein [Candidatus Aminicenantes bacterium]